MRMASILVVDDERNTCEGLALILGRQGHTVATAASGDAALAYLQDQAVDLIISDVKMPRMDGLALLRHVKTRGTGTVMVMMSGHSDVSTAVEAMKQGAFDYLVKPFTKDEVVRTVQKALTLRVALAENLVLKRQLQDHVAHARVIGSSPLWQRVCALVEQVAPSRATVLLSGETGTGKELIAHLLHRLSPRAERPFITLNVAALPASLLEAELFGYEKGAFTGALQRKPGRFELADQGTLFLDEIGEMSAEVQAKLLRVLQEGTFERLGGTRTLRVDVRLVTATNKDIEQEVAAQRFRADLYYRINVITIQLPPLRERREDIPLLSDHFLRMYAQQNHKDIAAFQPQALQRLQAYDWPGNVRELANVIERAVVLAQGPMIGVSELPPHLQDTVPLPVTSDHFVLPAPATLAEIERAAIAQALQHSGGNRQAAARLLDIGVATLYRKLKEYSLL
jgi:DNA-binding NtrC family response regulator